MVLGDVNDAGLEMATKELGDASSACTPTSWTRTASPRSAHAVETHGRLDIGVNAAGLGAYSLSSIKTPRRGHRDGGEPPRRDAVDQARSPSDGRAGNGGSIINLCAAQRDPAGRRHGPLLRDQGRGRHVHEVRRWSWDRTASGSTRSALGSSTRRSPRPEPDAGDQGLVRRERAARSHRHAGRRRRCRPLPRIRRCLLDHGRLAARRRGAHTKRYPELAKILSAES